ncbi:MAG: hypothetical protein AB8G23_12775 [Myxococcota bacterium]
MPGSIGPLLPSDEDFTHQVVETFATVGPSDPAWTEKVCGMAAARDGSFQIGFGFGKYTNRNVVDAYAGIARGAEQWTVRASRALHRDPSSVNVGPISYEVIEPLERVRIRLAANDAQPISFDIMFRSVVPCVVEDREDSRDAHGFRHSMDQIRYHQTGIASGWLEIDGERHEIREEDWVCTRDKSWGIRPSVGIPATDAEPGMYDASMRVLAVWNPILFRREDGSEYAFHHYAAEYAGTGFQSRRIQGGLEEPEKGRSLAVADMQPELTFDPATKRLQKGRFLFTMADGTERPMSFDKVAETGFYLGAGHYHGGDGAFHGSWRGELHVDGDHVEDAADPRVIERYGQFRDCLIRVEDPVGGGIGIGNCQTFVSGAWPDFGLTGEEPRF